jgi:hypothetical protein
MQKADIKEQREIPAPTSLSDKELQDARQLINIFILAWKNYGLYPDDHISTLKSFEKFFLDPRQPAADCGKRPSPLRV